MEESVSTPSPCSRARPDRAACLCHSLGMKRKLTPKTVEHLKAEGLRRLEVWDSTLPGFGIRVYPTGRKVWFVITRVRARQRRFTIGTHPVLSLGDARSKARQILRDVQMGAYDEHSPAPVLTTFGEAVALFVSLYAKPKNKGWRETERILTKFAPLYDRPLNDIRRAEIVRVLDALVAHGTPYRANRALSAIKKLLNWALNRGMIDVNPVAGQRMPTKEHARDRILSDDETKRLICAAEADGYPFGSIYLTLLLTGQRRGEVSAMRWSEVDLQQRLLDDTGCAIEKRPCSRGATVQSRREHLEASSAFPTLRLCVHDKWQEPGIRIRARQTSLRAGHRQHRLASARPSPHGCIRHGSSRHCAPCHREGLEPSHRCYFWRRGGL